MSPEGALAQGWRPEEGDTLEGTVTELSRGWSDYQNDWYPIVTIRKTDSDESVNVHCFHAVLHARMLDRQPHVGDRLIVTYHGKKETRDGKRSAAIYTVDTPDRPQDAATFWQGVGSSHPQRNAVEPDVPSEEPLF